MFEQLGAHLGLHVVDALLVAALKAQREFGRGVGGAYERPIASLKVDARAVNVDDAIPPGKRVPHGSDNIPLVILGTTQAYLWGANVAWQSLQQFPLHLAERMARAIHVP